MAKATTDTKITLQRRLTSNLAYEVSAANVHDSQVLAAILRRHADIWG